MSKISRFQVPVAHNMFQKIHSTDYNNSRGASSSLPSISASKLQDQQQHHQQQQQHQQRQQQQQQQPHQRRQQQRRLSRVSSNSFLLRLLSIEERHEQRKYDRVRNGRMADSDRQAAAEEEGSDVKGSSFHQNSKINQDKSMVWTRDTNTVPRQRDSESRLPSLSNDHQGTHDTLSTSNVHKSLPTIPSNQGNNNTHPDQGRNSNVCDIPSSFSTSCDHNPDVTNDSFDLTDTRHKPLRLAPLLLPPVHSVRPRPLKHRDFLSPTTIRGPISDKEWEELIECRYIRHATPRHALKWTPSRSYIR